jgi:hypothetical protein
MRKQAITAFFYYSQEMLIYLLVSITFFTLNQDIVLALDSTLSWLLFIYLSGVIPLVVMKKSWASFWFYFHFPIVFICGLWIWSFSFVDLAILLLFPFWRMIHLLETPAKPAFLYKRFIMFSGLLLVSYFIINTMSFVDLHTTFSTLLWIQFSILILGLLSFQYLHALETTGVTLLKWLQRQAILFYIAITLGFVFIVGPLLIPVFRYIVYDIPGKIFAALASYEGTTFFDWLFKFIDLFRKENSSLETEGGEGRQEWELLEDVLEQESMVPEWVNQTLLFLVQGGIILFVVLFLYYIIRNFYFVPQASKTQGEKSFEPSAGKKQSKSWFRRPNWAKDEVRRLYQGLIVYSQKKGEEIKASDTAREWSNPYTIQQGPPDLWLTINQLYEQKRYSNTPLTEGDVNQFKADVQMAKKELDRYYKKKQQDEKEKK